MKVFMVFVEVVFEVPVVAPTKEAAQEIAESMWEEDFQNGSEPVVSAHAVEIVDVGVDHKHTIPYGVDDDHPGRDWDLPRWIQETRNGPSA